MGRGTQWFLHHNNQKLDPEKGDVFYIIVLCMSCCGEQILNLFLSDLTSHSATPSPYHLRFLL